MAVNEVNPDVGLTQLTEELDNEAKKDEGQNKKYTFSDFHPIMKRHIMQKAWERPDSSSYTFASTVANNYIQKLNKTTDSIEGENLKKQVIES